MGAWQANPGFISLILLSKLVRYAFPTIWFGFVIYPKQIGRRAGILQKLRNILVDQKCDLLMGESYSKMDQNLGSQEYLEWNKKYFFEKK